MTKSHTDGSKDVPRIVGPSLSELLQVGDKEGVFHVDRESFERNIVFEQARFCVGTHQSAIDAHDAGCLILAAESDGELTTSFDGDVSEHHSRSGFMLWAPGGVTQEYDFRGDTTNIVTMIYPDLLDKIREQNDELRDVTLDEPWFAFSQPRLARIVLEQNRLIRTGDMGWRSLADANMVQLAVELMCVTSRRNITPGQPLSSDELGVIEDYARARLDTNLGLTEVADLAGRPIHGFCRAFKAATGESFRRYTLNLRLEEAERLLAETSDSLAEVAYATGFSSQSHFTSTMGRMRGVTPGRFRADNKAA